MPIIKQTLLDGGCQAKLTMVVPNRQHNLRFYPPQSNPQDKPWDQNLRPGTVIDKVVVHPSFFEFYCLAHQARQVRCSLPSHYVLV